MQAIDESSFILPIILSKDVFIVNCFTNGYSSTKLMHQLIFLFKYQRLDTYFVFGQKYYVLTMPYAPCVRRSCVEEAEVKKNHVRRSRQVRKWVFTESLSAVIGQRRSGELAG